MERDYNIDKISKTFCCMSLTSISESESLVSTSSFSSDRFSLFLYKIDLRFVLESTYITLKYPEGKKLVPYLAFYSPPATETHSGMFRRHILKERIILILLYGKNQKKLETNQ